MYRYLLNCAAIGRPHLGCWGGNARLATSGGDQQELVNSVSAVLRRHGPLPLSKVTSLLDDYTLEAVCKSAGGLTGFCKQHHSTFTVVALPSSVRVVVSTEQLRTVALHDRPLVLWVVSTLAAAEHLPSASQTSTQPTADELYQRLRATRDPDLLQAATSGQKLASRLRCYSSVISVVGDRIRLTRAGAPSLSTSASSPNVNVRVQSIQDPRLLRLEAALSMVLPSTFYVPLSYVRSHPRAVRILSKASPLGDWQDLFSGLPSGWVDVRQFGESFATIYVRRLRLTSTSHSMEYAQPEGAAAVYNVFRLAERMTAELRAFQHADHLNLLRLVKGLSMPEVMEALSPQLAADIVQFFSHDKDGCVGLPGVLILVFDRLRHLYDVHLEKGIIRPWFVLPPEEQPSSLTAETSPIPRVLLAMQQVLEAGPLPSEGIATNLGVAEKADLLSVYDTSMWAAASPQEVKDASRETVAECVRAFVSHHSLFFAVQNGRVFTPQFLAASAGRPRKQGGEAEITELLFRLLPVAGAVEWASFLWHPAVRAKALDLSTIKKPDFVKRYPQYFRTYDSFMFQRLLVGRANGTPPPADLLQCRQSDIYTILKMMALLAIGGTTEGAIYNGLTGEGRRLLKRFGSPVELAEQLPMWFDVRRDKFNPNNTLLTYTGTCSMTEEEELGYWRGSLPLRTVRNDASLHHPMNSSPSSASACDKEWHPDWNED